MRPFSAHRAVSFFTLLAAAPLAAQQLAPESSGSEAVRTTHADIRVDDLRQRLSRFADDSMRGRLMGSEGSFKATSYLADEARRIGLTPAGDSGTFFQTVPVVERSVDTTATIGVSSATLHPWTDFVVRDQGPGARSLTGARVVYGGRWGDPATLLPAGDLAGKLVVLTLAPTPANAPNPGTVARAEVTARFADAAGIAVVGMDLMAPQLLEIYRSSTQSLRPDHAPELPTFLYVTRNTARQMLGADPDSVRTGTLGGTITGSPRIVERTLPFPARNVVALLPGRDPALRGEVVVLGAHSDHIGVRPEPVAHDSAYALEHLFRPSGADDNEPQLDAAAVQKLNAAIADERRKSAGRSARPDSIYNGADDDGSGSVALLEIAEYLAARGKAPAKRSLLFVWHVGEEEGLFGSHWFTDHPTVPRDSIVTELNADMIGRGGPNDVTGHTKQSAVIHGSPDYLQVVGSRRLSTELGDLIEDVNRSGRYGFQFDYALDADGHPQNIYCRSDHYEYARWGIPIAFFTTGGHADYHQVTDEVEYIDFKRLARVSRFLSDVAVHVADMDHRPLVDKPKPDPNATCKQ